MNDAVVQAVQGLVGEYMDITIKTPHFTIPSTPEIVVLQSFLSSQYPVPHDHQLTSNILPVKRIPSTWPPRANLLLVVQSFALRNGA